MSGVSEPERERGWPAPLPGGPLCPWRSRYLEGIGGQIQREPDDFIVEELPAYAPSGEGPHHYVWIEKRGLSTGQAVQLLAQAAGCDARDLGWAGRKDRHAVTRQWISLPRPAVQPSDARVRILTHSQHRNKLKPGHLRGNRFEIRVRGVHAQAEARLPALLAQLRLGFPNYYGEQRFGRDNLEAVRAVALGQRRARRDELHFLTSVAQSAVFNLWLGARVAAGLLDDWCEGDVLQKRATGGLFVSADASDAQRLRSGEVDLTGPLPGPRMKAAQGPSGASEQRALEALGLPAEAWARLGRTGQGARRVARVIPEDLHIELAGDVLHARFALPAGSFATVLLSELCHPQGPLRRGEPA